MAFGAAFFISLLIFSEYNTSSESDISSVLFKRGTKGKTHEKVVGSDEEKNAPAASTTTNETADPQEVEKALLEQPPMTNIFSWQHVSYTVHVSGGERQLLDDVSGYVAPGKLTALMGESGAGKVRFHALLLRFMLIHDSRLRFSMSSLSVLASGLWLVVCSLMAIHCPQIFKRRGIAYQTFSSIIVSEMHHSGYCQQMDTHVPTDTVREALLFSAKLRQPSTVPLAEKEA